MFFICESFPSAPMPGAEPPDMESLFPAHLQFVQRGIDAGLTVFGGPKSTGGGFLLVSAPSMEKCMAYLDSDPLVVSGVQSYRVTPFAMHEHNPCLDALWEKDRDGAAQP